MWVSGSLCLACVRPGFHPQCPRCFKIPSKVFEQLTCISWSFPLAPHKHWIKCQRCKGRAFPFQLPQTTFPTRWNITPPSSGMLVLPMLANVWQASHAHSTVAGPRATGEDVLCTLPWCSVLSTQWLLPWRTFCTHSLLDSISSFNIKWQPFCCFETPRTSVIIEFPQISSWGSTASMVQSCSGKSVVHFGFRYKSAALFISQVLTPDKLPVL